jgi:hypothetical protein
MATITTINGGDLPSNSRTDINANFANLNADKIETSTLDTDTTLAANSDDKIPTQKAVKAYVDAGGNVNASETARGIVEIATTAEIDAGTAVGGTGARLVVTPDALKATQAPIVRVYTSNSTWTKPTGLKHIIVEVVGPGGAGGAGSRSSGTGFGGGGGAGGYSRKQILPGDLASSVTVTVPTSSSASSFGAHCSATAGGVGSSNTDTGGPGGVGGTGTGGDVNFAGSAGGTGGGGGSGAGGNSYFGGGAVGIGTGGGGANGIAGTTGSGGSGGTRGGSGGTNTGGDGGPGIVIVTEYYS